MNLSSYTVHDSYKPSGIEWIGDIPAAWSQVASKHLFELKKCPVGKRAHEYDLLSLTLRGIIKRDMENPEGKFPAEFDTYQEVNCGDFVFCLFDVEETPRTVGLSEFDGMITGAYTVFRPKGEVSSKFLYFFFLNADTGKKLRSLYKGLRNTIPKDLFATFKVPLPEHAEQHAIAAFLDEKCAKIDEAVRIKEAQIKLLRERRQILIQQAVTRGLNPDASMKDSGIDWIGQIPAHWEVKRLRHLTSKVGSGVTPTGGALTYIDGGVPLLRSQNIHFDGLDLEGVARISPRVHSRMSNSQVKVGDVLLNITGGSIGRCCFVDIRQELNVNQHVCIVRPTEAIRSEYLSLLLSSEVGQGQIWFFQQGGGREGLNFEAIKGFVFALPPLSEQTEIIEKILAKTSQVDNAISLKESQITKLKEYKTTLINAAVTGKIKVC